MTLNTTPQIFAALALTLTLAACDGTNGPNDAMVVVEDDVVAGVPAFEVVVSAGGSTVTQGLVAGQNNPATFANGIPSGATPLNTALRIADDGSFLGTFVTDGTMLEDPRDIIFFVQGGSFAVNDPRQFASTGFPPGGSVLIVGGENRVAQYDFAGNFLGNLVDFGFVEPVSGVQLNAGGMVVTPTGNVAVGARPPTNEPLEFDANTGAFIGGILPMSNQIEFIRGYVFSADGTTLFLGNGSARPPAGNGGGNVVIIDVATSAVTGTIDDAELSPLDVILTPAGTILTSSEFPFGDANATNTVREYDPVTGNLLRVCSAPPGVGFARPRGLGIGPDGLVYASSTGTDSILRFDISGTDCAFVDVFAEVAGLNGQGFAFIPAP